MAAHPPRRYIATPAFAAHDQDARRQRAAANKARREAEQALVALHRRAHPEPAMDPNPGAGGRPAVTAALQGGTEQGKLGGAAAPAIGAGGGGAAQGVAQGGLEEGPGDAGDGEPAVNPFLAAPQWEDRAAPRCKLLMD